MLQHGLLFTYLAGDHRRLEDLLHRAVKEGQLADSEAYGAFRRGLLRHIAIEEKLLIPAAHARRGGEPLPIAAKLRLDHGAIAALLVPVPTPNVVAALHAILADHNVLEEGPGGLYEICEVLLGDDESLVAEMRARPEPPVNPVSNDPLVIPAARRALARAGYDLDELERREHD